MDSVPQSSEVVKFRNPVEQVGFAKLYHVLTLDQNLSDGAYRLYALLLMYARQDAGAWPGVDLLAGELGVNRRTISRRFDELQARGIVTRERRFGSTTITWLEDLGAVYADNAKQILKEREAKKSAENRTNVRTGQKCPVEGDKNVPTVGTFLSHKQEATEEEANTETVAVAGITENSAKLSRDQEKALKRLADFGVDLQVGRQLVERNDAARVAGWLDVAHTRAGLRNPAGWLVSRLQSGESPPAVDKVEHARQEARRRGDDGFERPPALYAADAARWGLEC